MEHEKSEKGKMQIKHEKSATRKKCNKKKMQREKKVQHEESATQKSAK